MRLLMTTDTIGGVWTYALELARALQPHGVETALATMGALPSRIQIDEAVAVPGLTLHPSSFKLEWMDEPWEDVARAGDWLLGLEGSLQPDAVHLNGYAHGSLSWQAPVLVVGHSCVLSWWKAVKGESAPASWDRYRLEVKRGLSRAGMVVAPTGTMLHSLQHHYGPLRHCRVIHNARIPALFESRWRHQEKKERMILAAGRLWDEAKNIAALDAAAEGLPWPVMVVGEDAHPCGCRMAARRAQSLGRLAPADLALWMGRAAIYALPARYEPFGLSALEAALSGCTLVLGDIPSLREVWGDAARFVPPDEPAALQATLQDLIEDQPERERLARLAMHRAKDFSPDRMAKEYLAVYSDLQRRFLNSESQGSKPQNNGWQKSRDAQERMVGVCAL